MVLPNFLCIGAQKAGTTLLYDILEQHPEIYLAENKEAHFFSKAANYKRGLEWWSKTFFYNYSGQKVVGALTPEYLYYEEVCEMIAKDLGTDLKIIGILRHPVDRAYSHYLMSKRRGLETLSFEEALEAEPHRIVKDPASREAFSYASRGFYAEQVERFKQRFPPENLLWLSYEKNLCDAPQSTVQRILTFLEVEERPLNTNFSSNAAREVRSARLQQVARKSALQRVARRIIPARLRKFLRRRIADLNSKELDSASKRLDPTLRATLFEKYFSQENPKLRELTGIDFSYWNQQDPTT